MKLLQQMVRKKPIGSTTHQTSLNRCLNTTDLIFMCIGSMVGSGIYIITGTAAKEKAGPGIVLSFLIAGLLIYVLAACFAELTIRVQRTGSTYMFMYVSMGELPAFFTGWAIMLGCILGAATNARAWSAYLDFLFDGAVANFTETNIATWDVGKPMTEYPDFMAAGILLVITLVVSIGAQCTSKFNSIFVMLNVCVLIFFTVVGLINADFSNWSSSGEGNPAGFLPNGWMGVLAGSGACFWSFMGFEILAVAVEEADDPVRVIPIATTVALLFVTLLYIGTAASLTLVIPYYAIDTKTPLPSAFACRGIHWAKYIVGVGPLFGLTTTLLSSIYAFVRIVYAIAEDGLLMPIFARINRRIKIPLVTSLTGGLLTAVTALFFDLSEIISFAVVIGLLQYGSIAVVVILLRYRTPVKKDSTSADQQLLISEEDKTLARSNVNRTFKDHDDNEVFRDDDSEELDHIDLLPHNKRTKSKHKALHSMHVSQNSENPIENRTMCSRILRLQPSHGAVPAIMAVCCLLMLALAIVVVEGFQKREHYDDKGHIIILVLLSIGSLILLLLLTSISRCQQHTEDMQFKVPCVPWLPSLAIMVCCLLLVTSATKASWIGCGVILAISLLVYFSYSIWHSKLRSTHPDQVKLLIPGSDVEDEDDF